MLIKSLILRCYASNIIWEADECRGKEEGEGGSNEEGEGEGAQRKKRRPKE